MDVRPVHQLAQSLHASPRLFACVLGSGVSRSANIATGWEIVLELVRRHAALIGEGDSASADPARWYAGKYGREPDYSDIVSKLAPTTELRRSLLEPYFTVHDAVSGSHREHEPTRAHRSIARLVKQGLVRVVITTNFDRLLESALRSEGVAKVEVVSTPDEAANCYPFHAAEAFVLKLHGDWRDITLRNSREELAAYPRALAQLLRRIVSEHGLIVCGWSAEYDVALRQTIHRYGRRFPAYFVDPRPGEQASGLVRHLRAQSIPNLADDFFSELELAVGALGRRAMPPPLAGDVLVARARRFIADENEMELDDLVQDATRALCGWIEAEFDVAAPASSDPHACHLHGVRMREACEARAQPLAMLLLTLARYRQASNLAQRSLNALLRSARNRELELQASRQGDWVWFLSYPALLCAYAYGVSCVHLTAYQAAIDGVRDAGSGHADRELRLPAYEQRLFDYPSANDARVGNPAVRLANTVSAWLFPLVDGWIPRREDFERAFDRFDVLMCVFSWGPERCEWRPRCATPHVFPESPSARRGYQEVVEEWLVPQLRRREGVGPSVLWSAFPGITVHKDAFLNLESIHANLRRWQSSG